MFISCPAQTLQGTDSTTFVSLPVQEHQHQGIFVLPPGKKTIYQN